MKVIGFGVLFSCAALSLMGAEVTMDVNDDATALVVNVPAGLLTGCKLELASSVPAQGGTYTVDFEAHDLATGRVFRVFAGDEYTTLARVQQNSADDLIDTGIRDTTIWGCAYGHYCTGSAGNYSSFMGRWWRRS